MHNFLKNNVFDVDLSAGFLGSSVSFFPSEDETLHNVLSVVEGEYPALLSNFDMFLEKLRVFYFSVYLNTCLSYPSGVDREQNKDHECCDKPCDLLKDAEDLENF